MPRRKPKPVEHAAELSPAADTIQPAQTPVESASQQEAAATAGQSAAGEPQRQWTSTLPDPFGRYSIDLGDGRRLQLSRSGRWQQMQIRFVATTEGAPQAQERGWRHAMAA